MGSLDVEIPKALALGKRGRKVGIDESDFQVVTNDFVLNSLSQNVPASPPGEGLECTCLNPRFRLQRAYSNSKFSLQFLFKKNLNGIQEAAFLKLNP